MRVLLVMLLVMSKLVCGASAADVDAAIVFAVDVSTSISVATAKFQREGHAAAITEPRVLTAINRDRSGCIAVAYIEWASPGQTKLVLPWTSVCGDADALAVAYLIRKHGSDGFACRGFCNTSISSAIDASCALLDVYVGSTSSKIIDISANGTNNDGPLEASRMRALRKGYTINAIAIPQIRYGVTYHLTDYFEAHVIGGGGAFVIEPAGEHDYADALRNKFIREIGMAMGHDDH